MTSSSTVVADMAAARRHDLGPCCLPVHRFDFWTGMPRYVSCSILLSLHECAARCLEMELCPLMLERTCGDCPGFPSAQRSARHECEHFWTEGALVECAACCTQTAALLPLLSLCAEKLVPRL